MADAKQLLTYSLSRLSADDIGELLLRSRIVFKMGTELIRWSESGPVNSEGEAVNVQIGKVVDVYLEPELEKKVLPGRVIESGGLRGDPAK